MEMIGTEVGTALNLPSLLKDDPIAIVPMRASGYLSALDAAILYSQLPESARPGLTDGFANIPMSNPAYCWAGAGFLMTTPDCARFGAAMLDAPGSGISTAERALLFTPMTEKTKDSPPLGLAWRDRHGQEGPPPLAPCRRDAWRALWSRRLSRKRSVGRPCLQQHGNAGRRTQPGLGPCRCIQLNVPPSANASFPLR